ncbi:S-adenosylmethionine mitochondrial carrier protein-like isoform X2 [Uloborus diversus]|uniref:S-adenosylmethionine mitochondrial carrier protein-like isoform X2 n=1 Tax=Uloborus diversus TaxID=327109 RepID=UPI00240A2C07|nr:S-adenosylmethionine mitochondrial carrier protein-like isoform X2 [Uloborus diversus]
MADIHENNPSFTISLMSGAAAGLAVDLSLFPLDTMKTRLQSEHGFWKSGGFRNMYSGIGSVVVGSAPGAAVFFCTYETIKSLCHYSMFSHTQSLVHMFAASCGEVVSCMVRVPTEVVKQRAQANAQLSSWGILKTTIKTEGYRGLYRGYFCTLFREIPFSLIQFPIWEYLKNVWSSHQGFRVRPWQSSLCGAVAGSIAASITTPLDVAKTRIMLANKGALAAEGDIFPVIKEIYREEGFKSLFSGMLPRVLWISIGGAIFFGAYEKSKKWIS